MLRLRRIATPDPTHLSASHADARIAVAIRRRSAAKRMTLRVSGTTGEVVLTLPSRVEVDAAQSFLDAQAGWIAARLSAVPGRVPLADGEILPLRGVPHRIVHWSVVRGPTRAVAGGDGLPVIAVCGETAALTGRVRRFLVAEADADLRAAVSRHAARLGLATRRITVRDTTSRWGSCSSTGSLSFSWRLILAPPHVLDYLAAHEVAHLRELNHSHRFWKLVHDLCPGTEEAERWLKRNGSGLHRYG